ncbi:hypothetical protein FRZ61_32140 [Hypericibacter adhaerens]|uniref:Uncharacterized protein n=1 Tax=Hypericibacter adhaerens TaxID=2602016 RepID=A0A5J6MZQ8_9PROT|nr:hypothetical protein FRZ61_32140 [Hypericibacter adhaerens]
MEAQSPTVRRQKTQCLGKRHGLPAPERSICNRDVEFYFARPPVGALIPHHRKIGGDDAQRDRQKVPRLWRRIEPAPLNFRLGGISSASLSLLPRLAVEYDAEVLAAKQVDSVRTASEPHSA